MRKNPYKWFVALVVLMTVVLSVAAYVFVGVDEESERASNMLIGEMVDNSVMEALSEPVTVSRMIAQDECLCEILASESSKSEDEEIAELRSYLNAIHEQFGFASVYVISDSSKKYYTYAGLNKVIDPDNDSFDTWYDTFINSGKDYMLESSNDEANLDKLTIFVDARIEGASGNLLGVSGVGIETSELTDTLLEYEDEYDVEIDYVNSDGLVQLSGNTEMIRSSYVSGIALPETSDTSYSYQEYGTGGYAVVRYIPELDWYMVVRNDSMYSPFGRNYRFFFAETIILVIALALVLVAGNNIKAVTYSSTDRSVSVDKVTGLPNRNYLYRVYGEKGTLNTIQYQSIAEFSIDEYEDLEELRGTDRIVQSVVRTARETFGSRGQLIRWNRSSFVVLLEMETDEATEACRKLCRSVEDIGEVTISVGVTDIRLNETLKKNYYRAVQNMYLVRELGGNNVKRG
ncbi:MAG: diguanylate cyclase [Eubacterium sp.]|nr:diguanylate cyclase [Eubacterium sp.]